MSSHGQKKKSPSNYSLTDAVDLVISWFFSVRYGKSIVKVICNCDATFP